METWKKMSQANVDHYNNHPGEHTAITVVAAVVAVVAIRKMTRRLSMPPAINPK